jgi:periplasmic protein TonB
MLSIAPPAGLPRSRSRDRMPLALCASLAIHVCALALSASLRIGAVPPRPLIPIPAARPASTTRIVFTVRDIPGVMTGGGGGGNRSTAPIRRAESKGRDATTLRIARPVIPTGLTAPIAATAPLPGLLLDARPLASGEQEFVGLPSGGVSSGSSTGPGSGGGVGSGTGTGIGPGRGPGVGEGAGGGIGGGVYRVGGGVSPPRLIEEVRATYTADALHRRIQGSVVLQLIVTAGGTPTRIQVVQSLDAEGLDKEAVAAVSGWKFAPGRMNGRPVDVLVTVVLDFTIH